MPLISKIRILLLKLTACDFRIPFRELYDHTRFVLICQNDENINDSTIWAEWIFYEELKCEHEQGTFKNINQCEKRQKYAFKKYNRKNQGMAI